MVFGTVLERNLIVRYGIVDRVGRIENTARASGVILVPDFVADRIGHERMPTVDNLLKERGRYRVDEVRREATRRLEVDLVVAARFLITVGRIAVVKIVPELCRIDTHILDPVESKLLGVDVMDRKEARNAHTARRRGDKPRHPVVAVNKIGLNVRDAVVDDFALERQSELYISVTAIIDGIAIIKATVFRKMDALVGEMALILFKLIRNELRRLLVEHPAIMRQSDVNISSELVERGDERCRHVGHAARLRGHLSGEVAHAFRQIRNLRRYNENSRILRFNLRHKSNPPGIIDKR